MIRQILVELGRDLAHLRQASVGDVGKVVVLHVIANVEEDAIEGTVVAVRRFVSVVEEIVLRYEVTSQWVEAHAEKGAQ